MLAVYTTFIVIVQYLQLDHLDPGSHLRVVAVCCPMAAVGLSQ